MESADAAASTKRCAPFWRGSCRTAGSIFTPRDLRRSARREGLHRAEAGRAGLTTIRIWRACGSAFWRWAACRRPTATSRSISACSVCIRASTRPRFLPKLHAAGQVDLRDVFVDARDRDSAFDRACDESAASGAGRVHRERTVGSGRAAEISERRRVLELAQFLPAGRQVPEVLGAARVARPAHAKRSAAPSNGCWSAPAIPTAWRRFIRR